MVATRVRAYSNRDDWNNVECMTTANSRSASTGGEVAQPAFPNVCEGKLRQISPHRQRGGGQRLQRRRHGLAPAARAQCGREQRGHPRRLAYSSDFSQWVPLVNNIPTLASRLNWLTSPTSPPRAPTT